MDNRPLVSFCITVYNQRRYVTTALSAAFAQTYRPLEIVISDDCSTDGTDETIKTVIERYKSAGGDIHVIFNRNPANLGNLGNWLKFGELAHGELLVKADGDDISLPERTSRIVDVWLAGGKRTKCISHRAIAFDGNWRSLGVIGSTQPAGNWGCCCAYTPDCWSFFGNCKSLNHDAIDDAVFSRRVKLLNRQDCPSETVIPDALVYYRVGSGITTSSKGHIESQLVGCRAMLNSAGNLLADSDSASGRVEESAVKAVRDEVENGIREAECLARLLSGGTFAVRRRACAQLFAMGGGIARRIRLMLYLLPRPFGDIILDARDAMLRMLRRIKNGRRLKMPVPIDGEDKP